MSLRGYRRGTEADRPAIAYAAVEAVQEYLTQSSQACDRCYGDRLLLVEVEQPNINEHCACSNTLCGQRQLATDSPRVALSPTHNLRLPSPPHTRRGTKYA